jgi:hypothetical protein
MDVVYVCMYCCFTTLTMCWLVYGFSSV